MNPRSLPVAALALGLAACSSVEWRRPGGSPALTQADSADCLAWAQQEAWWQVERRDRLGLFGWPGPDRAGFKLMEEQRLMGECLRARGYQLSTVNR